MDILVYDKLTTFCAYQERCVIDVRKKLQRLKIDSSEYAVYIDKLVSENFINEDRYTKYFVSSHQKKKWGKTKIKAALTAKKIDPTIIKAYLDDMNDDDYESQLAEVATKKWTTIKGETTRERKTKLLRFLLGRGYEMNRALTAIKFLK